MTTVSTHRLQIERAVYPNPHGGFFAEFSRLGGNLLCRAYRPITGIWVREQACDAEHASALSIALTMAIEWITETT